MTRRAGFVVLLGLVLSGIAPLVQPEPVSAASGVDDYPSRLKNAAQDSLVDPWQFYNRECTSFVAWRLNDENGVAFNDYWQGQHWGNASHWKSAATALKIPVDNNPTRGAVAWWSAGSAGSSVGHVAWVQTASDNAITVEEYNYLRRGYYDTRIISSDSSLWPSGFIHIKDTQVRNTASPVVTGTAQVGQKLKTTRGTWNAKHLTFTYQWLADGKKIPGATKKTFRPGADQVGKKLQAKVTATKSGAHKGTAKSAGTDNVAKGVFVVSAAPSVSGKAQVGLPLATSGGTTKPAATTAYQWYAGTDAITGATGATFTPTPKQLGAGLAVQLSLSAPGYKTMKVKTDQTDAVAPGQFTATTPPAVEGTAQVDQKLTADPGTWNPPGKITYQWLVDGKAVKGATGTGYTPGPDDVRKPIAIQVTLHKKGYDDAVVTSAQTPAVVPGTFVNNAPPTVSGEARVGVTLTATPGSWSPHATVTYQWLVDGQPIPGATAKTFVPNAQDVGRVVSVEVFASRPGYTTAVDTSTGTAPVQLGIMRNRVAPVVSGHAVVGRTLRTDNGSWSVRPDAFEYQWYADGTAISGATGATYQPTADVAGARIHVVVTALRDGYSSVTASSGSTDPVVFGRIAFDKPTIRGHAVVGHTLTAQVTGVDPSTATAHYRWYRGRDPIRGARDAAYVVQEADLGHSLHMVVTMRAKDWVARTRKSAWVTDVRTQPRLHPHTSIRNGRVFLRLGVSAPGLDAVNGRARVWLGQRRVGVIDIADGEGSRLLAHLRHGTHTLELVYRGGPLETVGRATVTVDVP